MMTIIIIVIIIIIDDDGNLQDLIWLLSILMAT
jgi:hypothetical protein